MALCVLLLGGCRERRKPVGARLYKQAFQCWEEGKKTEALHIVDEALGSEKDPLWLYKLRVLKARIIVNDDPRAALQLLEAEPPAHLAITDPDIPTLRALTQGNAYYYAGDLTQAQATLKDARRLSSANAPKLQPKIAILQGLVLERQKNKNLAQEYYRETLNLARKYGDKSAETDALIDVGNILTDLEQYDQAIVEFSLALQRSRSAPVDRFGEEASLGHLGWSYYQIGDFGQAVSSLQKAEGLAASLEQVSDQALWSIDLGDVHISAGEYEDALESYSRGKSLASSAHDIAKLALAFHNLAQVELRRNNLHQAEEYNRQAMAALQGSSDSYLQSLCSLTAAEIAIQKNELLEAEPLLNGIIRGIVKKPNTERNAADSSMLWRAESDLAHTYELEQKSAKADHEFQEAIHTVENSRDALKQEDRRMSILDAWPFYDDYIQFLMHHGNASKALQIAEFSRARTLSEGLKIAGPKRPAEVPIHYVQTSLKRKQIVLAYWLSDTQSYLWVLTRSSFKSFFLMPKQTIEKYIQSYSDVLLSRQEDLTIGQKLYELLLSPAENLVRRASEVIILPNRSLYRLNFETLVVPGRKPHYWIKDITVKVGASLTLLSQSSVHELHRSRKVLLIGAPKLASNEFPVLRHADEEIQKVASHFPEAQKKIIDHEAAIPSAYRLNQPFSFDWIHFVTHGTASQISPLDSAIILSPETPDTYKLYARDIMGIPIHAELVIISACYGAGTHTYSGEGLVGLAWSFLRAGAHQVIAGLWEVDDRITPDLMDDLYGDLQSKNAAAALRAAKLKMLEGPGHLPFYWASLQLYVAHND